MGTERRPRCADPVSSRCGPPGPSLGRESTTGRTLPVYNAVDRSATPDQASAIDAVLQQAPGQLNFLSGLYGPYPFDSTGAVADRAAGVGYALEVQGKPHYAGGFTTMGIVKGW